jgi:outer membrane protein assembly factor BamE
MSGEFHPVLRYHPRGAELTAYGPHMRKLLIYSLLGATFVTWGCSRDARFPFAHRIDVQQGNVLTQEAVNQLRPGMSQRQVRFLLGTPLLSDPFHLDRWDYVYLMQYGNGKTEEKRVSVFFEQDKLTRIEGTMRPGAKAEEVETSAKVTTVTVPPQERKPRGWLTRFWYWLGFGGDEV